jgi:hypothetical protein
LIPSKSDLYFTPGSPGLMNFIINSKLFSLATAFFDSLSDLYSSVSSSRVGTNGYKSSLINALIELKFKI